MGRVKLDFTYTDEICHALKERYDAYLKDDEYFYVSGFRSEKDVEATITLRNEDESFYYPVDCRIDLVENDLKDVETALSLVLDFQDFYFSRFLKEQREVLLPIDWAPFSFEDCTLYARGQIQNRKLEKLADQWIRGEFQHH